MKEDEPAVCCLKEDEPAAWITVAAAYFARLTMKWIEKILPKKYLNKKY